MNILKHLDKSYGIDTVDQLDLNLAAFLDYSWSGNMYVEQFIAGFHSRLDKIAELAIDDKLKGHLLLRQAGLDGHSRNMIVGASAGNYDVTAISTALRQAFRNADRPSHTTSAAGPSHPRSKNDGRKNYQNKYNRRRYDRTSSSGRRNNQSENNDYPHKKHNPDVFYTYRTVLPRNEPGAIVDSGACSSVVGQKTLDAVLSRLGTKNIAKVPVKQTNHRFGDYKEDFTAICGIQFPFHLKSKDDEEVTFKVHFDVIPGNLPFLIGWPSLRAMRANINCEYMNLGLKLKGNFYRVPLIGDEHHVYLPFQLKSRSYYKQYSIASNNSNFYTPASSEPNSFYTPADTTSAYYCPAETISATPLATYSKQQSKNRFDPTKLKKLHLALKHGSATAMQDWLKSAGVWHADLKRCINELLLECSCKVSIEPKPHPIVSTNLPERHKQTSVSLDILFLEGTPVMHIIDKCTGWSETSALRRRLLEEQVETFVAIWIYRHGLPKKIHADREYFRGVFAAFARDNGIQHVELAANDHEANGAVERANRTLRNFFRRLRSEKPKVPLSSVLREATYAKNICKGSKLASSFELQYGQQPRIMQEFDVVNIPAVSVAEHIEKKTNDRLNKMVNTKPRSKTEIKVGDFVYYWRDNRRWLGPGRVIDVGTNVVTIVHDEKTLSSSFNRIQKTIPPTFQPTVDEDELLPHLPQSTAAQNQNELQSNQATPQEHPLLPPSQALPPREPIMTRSRARALAAANQEANNTAQITAPSGNVPWVESDQHYATPSTSLVTEDSYPHSFPSFASISNITQADRISAYRKERANWHDMCALDIVPMADVSKSANLIGSHVRYIRKMDGTVKARICPWGNHDIEKNDLRKDAPSMLMEIFRLVVSIGVEHRWDIGSMDVRAAFLQADGFSRTIFVRPPREEQQPHVLWKLLSPAYGLVDSGRLWYLTSNAALCKEYGLTRSVYEPTLYFGRNKSENLSLLVVVQVDNYIYTGSNSEMSNFESFLRAAFDVGEISHNCFDIYGATLRRTDDGTVVVNQDQKLDNLSRIDLNLPKSSVKNGNDIASPDELTLYRNAIGQCLFVGRMSHPVLLRISSMMATKTSSLRKHHLKDLYALIRYAIKNAPTLTFKTVPASHSSEFSYAVYSDGSMGTKKDDAARGGFIIFRCNGKISHPIYWHSRKLRRVARSSATAEILSAADAMDKAAYLSVLTKEIYKAHNVHQFTDSRGLFNLIATTKEPEESRNKIDLASMRAAFEDGITTSVRWIPGYYMVADALTKDNRISSALVNNVLNDGEYLPHPDELSRMTPKGDVLSKM